MRCESCSKFVSFEENDPEVGSLDISDDGNITGDIRIVNSCADCCTELKEYTFDINYEYTVPEEHKGAGHELAIEEDGCERTSKSGYYKKGVWVPAGGRYAKMFYGYALDAHITCSCANEEKPEGAEEIPELDEQITIEDFVQASSMDELC